VAPLAKPRLEVATQRVEVPVVRFEAFKAVKEAPDPVNERAETAPALVTVNWLLLPTVRS